MDSGAEYLVMAGYLFQWVGSGAEYLVMADYCFSRRIQVMNIWSWLVIVSVGGFRC